MSSTEHGSAPAGMPSEVDHVHSADTPHDVIVGVTGNTFGSGDELARDILNALETAGFSIVPMRPPNRHGLYVLHWRSGGSSLASVGSDAAGNRWYMPTNWINGPGTDWSEVEWYELIKAPR